MALSPAEGDDFVEEQTVSFGRFGELGDDSGHLRKFIGRPTTQLSAAVAATLAKKSR